MPLMRRALPISLFALATTLATGAGAQDAGSHAAGRALFNEGVALMRQGKVAEGCAKLEESLKQYPGIGTRGKLAECYEKLGRYVTAWTTYREVAQLAARSGEPAREQVASERAKALEPKLSYVTVAVPASSDATGLVVKRDGHALDRSELGTAQPVDAGTIVIEVTAEGKKPLRTELSLAPGQSARFDVPALEPAAPARSASIQPKPHEGEDGSWQKPVGLVLAGVGVAGLVAGGVLGLSARSTYDGAFDDGRCDHATNQCDASGQSAVDDARSKATLSTIFFAAGGVCAVLGAVVFFTAPSSSSRAVRVAPTTYAGGGGLVAAGSF